MIVSTALPQSDPRYSPRVSIVCSKPTERVSVQRLTAQLTELLGFCPLVESMRTISQREIADSSFIVLDHLGAPSFGEILEEEYSTIQKLSEAAGLLWVTEGATQEGRHPNSAMVTGISHVLRVESNDSRHVTLQKLSANDSADVIFQVFRTALSERHERQSIEHEYSERGGLIYIPWF